VFGPVPTLYRFIVWLCGLAAFAGLGVWVSLALPYSATLLAVVGVAVGTAVMVLFLHDFEDAQRAPARRPHA